MLAVLGGCLVILAVIGLGFYAVRKMRPGSFRLRTTLLRMFSFSLEVESAESDRNALGDAGQGTGAVATEDEASALRTPDALPRE